MKRIRSCLTKKKERNMINSAECLKAPQVLDLKVFTAPLVRDGVLIGAMEELLAVKREASRNLILEIYGIYLKIFSGLETKALTKKRILKRGKISVLIW